MQRKEAEECLKLRNIEQDGRIVPAKTVQELMDDWMEMSYQRVLTGKIMENAWNCKRYLFQNGLKNYFETKVVKRITDLQPGTFDEYRFWRMTVGWKFYSGKNLTQRKPPTDGTINSEIGLIDEWYNNYLMPKGYVTRKPRIKTKVLDPWTSRAPITLLPLQGLDGTWTFPWMD